MKDHKKTVDVASSTLSASARSTITPVVCGNLGVLSSMAGVDAAQAIGRAYHLATQAATRTTTGTTGNEDKLKAVGLAFGAMGAVGGALGLSSSASSKKITTTVKIRNEATIVMATHLIDSQPNADELSVTEVTHSPGLLLPGDESSYKYCRNEWDVYHRSTVYFAVASLDSAVTKTVQLGLWFWQDYSGSDAATTKSYFHLCGISISDGLSGSTTYQIWCPAGTRTWPDFQTHYYQFLGSADHPSFGIASIPTNTQGGSDSTNSLQVTLVPDVGV